MCKQQAMSDRTKTKQSANTPVTLKDFFAKMPKGEASRMAKAIGASKGYISALANGYVCKSGPKKGKRVTCSGSRARSIAEYGEARGYEINVSPLCGLEDA